MSLLPVVAVPGAARYFMAAGTRSMPDGSASRTILDIENGNDNPRLSTLFGIVRALKMDANDIFYPEIKSGTPNQVKLQTTFADCSDSEAEMLFEVCVAVLSSLRKKECAYIETQDKKEPASPVV